MKTTLLFKLALPALIVCLSCCESKRETGYSSSSSPEPATAPPLVNVVAKVKFNGRFEGRANNTAFRLDLSNENNVIKGSMKDGENSFLLEGSVINDVMTGTMKYILGDMPFQGYYQGPSLVLQFDKQTMDALKLSAAASADDASALLADDKIVFNEK
jgi:hypothetical protein